MTVDRDAVERWMRAYERAWSSNDPDDVGALFSDDASYHTGPHRQPWVGRSQIVQGWLDRKDEPGDWSFRWETLGTTDDTAFVRGWTDYPAEGARYHNLWVIRLDDDGRCSSFTEWWMAEGDEG